uniref:MIT domain-containing protein n=1 Tax=Pristionchus pacificus TaxID=54126 RepID=A0A2A6B481_PRIPA|eukprot:PDM60674.1 hypothetical protein PRIPAC_53943 [Pristionchus pacificus]
MTDAWRPFVDAARPFLAQAAQHDQKADPQPAIENYMAGIEKLMAALKLMESSEQKQRLNGEIIKYMQRAEFLKGNTSFEVESMRTHRIPEDSIGHSYERIFKDVLNGDIQSVHVFDAYVAVHHQVLNFVRFCELVVQKAPKLRMITLTTSEDSRQNAESFKELAVSLEKRKIRLNLNYNYLICLFLLLECQMSLSKERMATSTEKLSSFRARLQTEAETLVLEVFPQKVLDLDKMIFDEKYSFSRLSEILPAGDLNIPVPEPVKNGGGGGDAPVAKKRKIGNGEEECAVMANNGIIPKNEHLGELMEEIRPMIRDAVEDMNKIKMWITLLIPRIEDGNNFGVSIQEEALNEVRATESEAASFLDQLSRYFVGRAKLLTKVAKYPHVADYRRAILDMDEKQFVNIRLIITELRNHFATLHDMITKNMEKIKKPRSSNHDSMY